MFRRTATAWLAVVLWALPITRVMAQTDEQAKAIAVKVTTAGATTFDTKDAKAMAATYTDDAQLHWVTRNKDTGSLETETKRGRAEVEGFYADLFKGTDTFHAKNTVEFARWISDDLLMIAGVFEPDSQAAEPLKLPFVQVRVRQGDAWRIMSLHLFFAPKK
jgi:hypothetical protein